MILQSLNLVWRESVKEVTPLKTPQSVGHVAPLSSHNTATPRTGCFGEGMPAESMEPYIYIMDVRIRCEIRHRVEVTMFLLPGGLYERDSQPGRRLFPRQINRSH